MTEITEKLLKMRKNELSDFNAKLIPNIDKSTIIGIQTSELKRLAKEMIKSGEAEGFLLQLPHKYFDENQLHAFILSENKELSETISLLDSFLPYVDNWATCDQLIPRAIAKNPEQILDKVWIWLKSKHTYTVRFAIGILMRYFLNERFDDRYPAAVAAINSDEYYIEMMQAWYFATALAKQYDSILPYFTEGRLGCRVHNKSIQKARESFRVTEEHKAALKELVIKRR